MFCIGWTLLWPSEPKKTEPFFCRVGVYILLCSWIVQFENVSQTLQIFTQMSHQVLWLTMSTLEDHMLISIWKIIMWISSELSNCPVLCSHTWCYELPRDMTFVIKCKDGTGCVIFLFLLVLFSLILSKRMGARGGVLRGWTSSDHDKAFDHKKEIEMKLHLVSSKHNWI